MPNLGEGSRGDRDNRGRNQKFVFFRREKEVLTGMVTKLEACEEEEDRVRIKAEQKKRIARKLEGGYREA